MSRFVFHILKPVDYKLFRPLRHTCSLSPNNLHLFIGSNQKIYTEEDLKKQTEFEINKAELLQAIQELTNMQKDRDYYRRLLEEEEKSHEKTKEKYHKSKNASTELVYLQKTSREKDETLKQYKGQYDELIKQQHKLDKDRDLWKQTVKHLSYANEQLRVKDTALQRVMKINEELQRQRDMGKDKIKELELQNHIVLADQQNGEYT